MPNIDFSIDIHTHASYKPFGKSFSKSTGRQSASVGDKTSLWFYNPASVADKLINEVGSLTKFSQANFTAASYGRLWVIAIGMGSIEKWFFNNKMGTGAIADILENFATEIGKPRINAIQAIKDYWSDLQQEYSFLQQMHNKTVNVDGNKYKYVIVSNFTELKAAMDENATIVQEENGQPVSIALVPTIEGLHILNCGIDPGRSPDNLKANPDEVRQHARELKELLHKPWFVTFTHHFYNELCGQSLSLRGIIAKTCDQHVGLNTGFTSLGKEVLSILLDDTDGKRILVDCKHMSPQARQEFFAMRETQYPGIPVFMSHGVANGLPTLGATVSLYPEIGNTLCDGEINFYDDEIVLMAKSGGILGLQLDERRLANDETIKRTKHSFFKNKIMHYRSELVWKQIQYMGELLDNNDLPAWSNLCLGSDYDGIVDPINSFWTVEQYPELKSYLERHAFNYMSNHSNRLKNVFNKIDADVIIQNIFQTNAWNFFERWFK